MVTRGSAGVAGARGSRGRARPSAEGRRAAELAQGGIAIKDLRVNEDIRARDVRLVGENGEQMGIVPLREALRIAAERRLDLVEVSPTSRPPVCRLMDYGRYKYEQQKRERESRKKQHVVAIKEVKMRPTIEEHDYDVKRRSATRFLEAGDKVKVTITFRGREIVHSDLARSILDRMAQEVAPVGQVERPARVEGRSMIMILAPRKGA
jgi:translation initiation factor IF-3